jgi:hypothetical protein
MGMADIMTKDRPFPADVANFCHIEPQRYILFKLTQLLENCKEKSEKNRIAPS